MQVRRAISIIIFAAAIVVAAAPAVLGEGRGTLLEWNHGESVDGGPDLDKPLVTDRPDFTESPTTVGLGVIQFEGGYTFTHDAEGGLHTDNHSFPELLVRIGVLAEWLEFRTEWNYEIERATGGDGSRTRSGADDLTLGFKIALTPQQECILPETGLILEMSVPSGGDAFSADEVLPGINYCYSWDLNDDWSLSGSSLFGGEVDDETSHTYTQFAQSFSLEREWTEKVKSYTEWYVLSPIGADTNRPQNYFNAGFTVLINNNVEWDIRAGVGLNEAADNFFAGSGSRYGIISQDTEGACAASRELV